jgi:ABC-type antimicrobial peptide transport system permease subunit
VVRTRGPAPMFALPVQKVIAGLDRNLPVAHVLTMDQVIGESTVDARFDATLLLAFAVLSLLLAMVGLFGVLSFLVAQRTTEIGVRIALGSPRERIMRLMLGDGLRPALWGLVLGLAASVGVTRLITSLLFGTHPLDPMVFVVVSVTLLLVAALACLLPAWRASRLDPIVALRSE